MNTRKRMTKIAMAFALVLAIALPGAAILSPNANASTAVRVENKEDAMGLYDDYQIDVSVRVKEIRPNKVNFGVATVDGQELLSSNQNPFKCLESFAPYGPNFSLFSETFPANVFFEGVPSNLAEEADKKNATNLLIDFRLQDLQCHVNNVRVIKDLEESTRFKTWDRYTFAIDESLRPQLLVYYISTDSENVTIPTGSDVVTVYTDYAGRDQYNTNYKVTFALKEPREGISIDPETGTVTITSAATGTDFTVVAIDPATGEILFEGNPVALSNGESIDDSDVPLADAIPDTGDNMISLFVAGGLAATAAVAITATQLKKRVK